MTSDGNWTPPPPTAMPKWLKDYADRLTKPRPPEVTLNPIPRDDLLPGEIGLLADGS